MKQQVTDPSIEALGRGRVLRGQSRCAIRALQLAVAAGALVAAKPAAAATFVVTNTSDAGIGSFRQALADANAAATGDTIVFDSAGVFAFPQTINLITALPQITNAGGALAITGTGSNNLTIQRDPGVADFRILDSLAPLLTVSGVTLTNGAVTGAGGAIQASNSLTLSNCVLTGNSSSGSGGAVRVNSGGSLNLQSSVVSGNTATGSGGGIYFYLDGSLTLENSTISGNTATAGSGGGIYAYSNVAVQVQNSVVSNNAAAGAGGGIYFFTAGALLVEDSTISGNTSTTFGGAVYFYGDVSDTAPPPFVPDTLVVRRSTISGNDADQGGGVNLRGATGTLLLENSTVSGNTATTDGGGVSAYYASPSVAVVNSTITGNVANGSVAGSGGGGIARLPTPGTPGGSLTVVNSVVWGNTNANAPDILDALADVDVTFSAIGSGTGFVFSATSGNNLALGTEPLLGTLEDNGGPTLTHLPAGDSPLLDVGSNAAIPVDMTTDQRGAGFDRILGFGVDIGAVELLACGDGVPGGGEECDDGVNNGLTPCGCQSDCTFGLAGTLCLAASGDCDLDDTCDGTGFCIEDLLGAGIQCRAAPDVCDVAESCDGLSPDCPTDEFAPALTSCRDAADTCDAEELCDGNSSACPNDEKVPDTTVCRDSAGVCDAEETCDGVSDGCPADDLLTAVTICRDAADVCDAEETCSGASVDCPPDAMQPSSVVCRDEADTCDVAETCDGSTPACPTDAFEPNTTVCRPADGDCDVADLCSGNGVACPADAFAGSNVACRAASCALGTMILAESCDGSGPDCPPATTSDCAPLVCGATSCLNECSIDDDCIDGFYCQGQQCEAQDDINAPCDANNQCLSDHCVDGVCCNSDCTGQCEACAEPGSSGTCTTVTGNPRGLRQPCASDGSACAGSCDGADAQSCAYPDAATECREASCTNGEATLSASCDGSGACPALQTQPCGVYACSGELCDGDCTTDANCSADAFCSGGVCNEKLDDQQACGGDNQCTNGRCVDGYCCDSLCSDQCEACNVNGLEGVCSPVTGAPVGGRPACAGFGVCAGECDGIDRTACAFPAATTECATGFCDTGVQTDPATCNGAGSCSTAAEQNCGAFACGATECLTACSTDGDCADGYDCQAADCVEPDAAAAGAGGQAAVEPGSGGEGNAPAASGGEGNAPAASGGEGNASTASGGEDGTEASAGAPEAGDNPAGARLSDEGGCGCRTPARGSQQSLAWLALVLLSVTGWRRFRPGSAGSRGRRAALRR